MPRLHKAQYRNRHYGSERSRDCTTKNCIFPTGKQTNRKTCLEIFINRRSDRPSVRVCVCARSVCVCVCVCARARARACCVCESVFWCYNYAILYLLYTLKCINRRSPRPYVSSHPPSVEQNKLKRERERVDERMINVHHHHYHHHYFFCRRLICGRFA